MPLTPYIRETGAPSPGGKGQPLPDYTTLLELVKRYSPSGQERPAVEYLVGRMQSLGYTQAFIDAAGNAVGVMGEGPRQVVLLGHIDTVPGDIPVRVEANTLYGRGTVDAKGSLAAFTDAVARVGPLPGWQFVVNGAVEEERESEGARYVKDQFHPEFALIGEPSGWERVTLGYKGSAWAEIILRTPQAHSAHQAQSAAEAAFDVWGLVRDWCTSINQGRERAFEQLTPTLRGLASGEDGFEAWASLRVGVRLPPDLDPESWYTQLERTLKDFRCSSPLESPRSSIKISVERLGYAISAYAGEKNTPLVRAMLAGIRAAGGQPGFVRKTGTADLNIVAPAWGCPALAYGPGDSALDHTPEEQIDLVEYGRAIQVLVEALPRLCLLKRSSLE